jgi:hypothetical protein
MNEHEPSGAPERQELPRATIEELGLQSDSSEQRSLWNDGLLLWGNVFAAYTRLQRPELHDSAVLLEFQMAHIVSHPDWETAVLAFLSEKQWPEKLDRFLGMYRIPGHLVSWSPEELETYLRDVFDCVVEGGQVHVFLKPDPRLRRSS